MRFSLINVGETHENGRVDGNWVQDFHGDISQAIERARDIEKVNSNRIDIAVVPNIPGTGLIYRYLTDLIRLDKKE